MPIPPFGEPPVQRMSSAARIRPAAARMMPPIFRSGASRRLGSNMTVPTPATTHSAINTAGDSGTLVVVVVVVDVVAVGGACCASIVANPSAWEEADDASGPSMWDRALRASEASFTDGARSLRVRRWRRKGRCERFHEEGQIVPVAISEPIYRVRF